jgi:hypothetical protein
MYKKFINSICTVVFINSYSYSSTTYFVSLLSPHLDILNVFVFGKLCYLQNYYLFILAKLWINEGPKLKNKYMYI